MKAHEGKEQSSSSGNNNILLSPIITGPQQYSQTKLGHSTLNATLQQEFSFLKNTLENSQFNSIEITVSSFLSFLILKIMLLNVIKIYHYCIIYYTS